MENFRARFKYVREELPEPQNVRIDGRIIASYEYSNILTMNASNIMSNYPKKCAYGNLFDSRHPLLYEM